MLVELPLDQDNLTQLAVAVDRLEIELRNLIHHKPAVSPRWGIADDHVEDDEHGLERKQGREVERLQDEMMGRRAELGLPIEIDLRLGLQKGVSYTSPLYD